MNNIINGILTIVIISFLSGFLALIGVPTIFPKLLITFLSLILFHYTISIQKKNNRNFIFQYINYFFLYSAIVFLSVIYNKSDIFKSFSFYHYTLVGYIIFLIVCNLKFNKKQILKILFFIENLFILQICFTIFKFFYYGQKEALIGTISLTSGQLNTILPLIGIAYYLSKYSVITQNKKYILLGIGMLFISYVGEKRIIYFILPIVVALFYLIYNKSTNYKNFTFIRFSKYFLIFSVFSFLFIYYGAKYNPTLNPENIKGGSFNLDFILNYIISYNFNFTSPLASGRLAGLITVIFNISIFEYNSILGYGPDYLIGFTDTVEYNPLRRFGLYSAMSANGFITYIISIGILGTLLFISIYYKFIICIYNNLNQKLSKYGLFINLFSFMLIVIFIFDFFIYSRSLIHHHATSVLFFLFMGLSRNKFLIFKL